MRTTSGGGGSSLGPQLCPRPLSDARDEDNEFTFFSAMLIGGTASVILWGICIVVVLILRSKG